MGADRQAQRRRYDQHRDSPSRLWYKTAAWKIRRRDQLAQHPTCCLCDKEGVVRFKERMVVDHYPRHNNDWLQFFQGPVRTLCKHHHDSTAQADEARGFSVEVGADGWPADPNHPQTTGGVRPPMRK